MRAIIIFLFVLATTSSYAEPLRLLAWNVESGGNDPAVIAKQLQEELAGYHIYGLCEVDPGKATAYRQAVGDNFASVLSVTGNRDRLLLIYDKDHLELIESPELEAHDGVRMNDVNFRHRSPLVGHFKIKETNEEFLVVLVHLARGNAELRTQQAKGLRLWCADQKLPAFGIGDFNFDFDFPTQKGNEAYDEFISDGNWTWVRPSALIDTNWSDRDGDGKDDYPDSCLDFTFAGGTAREWQLTSAVVVRPGDFPDDEKTSDHRPVVLTVGFSADTPEEDTSDDLQALRRERVDKLQAAATALREMYFVGDVSFDRVAVAENELLEAKLDLADTQDQRLACIRDQVRLAEQRVKTAQARFTQGFVNNADLLCAEAYLLKMRIMLAEESAVQTRE